MRAFLQKHLDDVLVLTGSGLIVFATWLLSWIAAIYVAGGILIVLGVLIGIGNGRSAASSNAGAPGAGKKGDE